eukprot:21268-Heterococcus_DN1.PRE.6
MAMLLHNRALARQRALRAPQATTLALGSAASSCTQCPAGTYSTAGAAACTACPTGSFSAMNSAACTQCNAGSYVCHATVPRAVYYCSCPLPRNLTTTRTLQGASASACLQCAAGYFSAAGAATCTACPAGSYSAANAAACTQCAAGTSSVSTVKCTAQCCVRLSLRIEHCVHAFRSSTLPRLLALQLAIITSSQHCCMRVLIPHVNCSLYSVQA